MTLRNSTFSGNTVFRGGAATGSVDGGGIYAIGGANIWLNNMTVAGNRLFRGFGHSYATRGGGVFITSTAVIMVQNTLIGDNVFDNGISIPQPDDCFGPLRSFGFTLIESTANCSLSGTTVGNIPPGQDRRLGLLRDNGGSSQTQALLPGSPAIDAANPAGCTDNLGALITTDQRGFGRPANGGVSLRCDIGAYEFYPFGLFLPLIGR